MTIQQRLLRSAPELQGVSSTAVTSFLTAVHEKQLELHSFMLLRHGHVLAEGWWHPYAPDRPHTLFSLSKSFASTAIGLLVHEGRLSLDDRVVTFFPDDTPADPSAYLSAMAVRHLLMMGTGHAEDTTGKLQTSDNWVANFLQAPVEYEPGTHFIYNSGATYMLSAIANKVTGESLLDYLEPRLLQPLGIEGAVWDACPRGIQIGGWGLKIKTEDIAKFGQLYLQKGVWHEHRLLSEAWVEEATCKIISNDPSPNIDWSQGYGYQFWRSQYGAYRGDGAFGQYCIVMPEQDAVVAITSGVSDMQAVLNAVWLHLLPNMGGETLPPDVDAEAALVHELQQLSLAPPRYDPVSAIEPSLSEIMYRLEANAEHKLSSFSVHFEHDRAIVHLQDEQGDHHIAFGRNEWLDETASLYMGYETPAVGSMSWRDANTLVLTLRFVETPFCFTCECTFGDGDIQLIIRQNLAFDAEEPKPIRGKMRV